MFDLFCVPELASKGDDSGSKPASVDSGLTPEKAASLASEEETAGSVAADTEVACGRCPYRSSSRLALSQHAKHHAGPGDAKCLECDFACASRDQLLGHARLHFPAKNLDMDALNAMIAAKKSAFTFPSPAPDASKEVEGEKAEDTPAVAKAESKPCRVYACRYCDEEFTDKSLMIQHEGTHQ